MKSHLLWGACVFALMQFSAMTNAALIDRGNGMIYDDDLKITWLEDANYAQTSGYDDNGKMNWFDARLWAANLEFGGFDDWRLPSTSQPDPSCSFQNSVIDGGYNCSNSEMSHLYYAEIGGLADSPPPTSPFQNLQYGRYWSDTTVAPSDPDNSWFFDFSKGWQGGQLQIGYEFYAWAVREGDVAAVPAPATVWLFTSGLIGLVGMARRKAALTNDIFFRSRLF